MLQNIRKNVCANTGGLKTLWFIPITDVVSIPDSIYHIIADPVELAADKGFFSIDITEDSFNFSEKETKVDEGKIFDVNISGFIAGDTNLLIDTFEDMSDLRFIVLAKDGNDYTRIVGTISNGLKFKHDFDTQSASNGRKGTQISFYGTYDFRQYFYQSIFAEVTSEGISNTASDLSTLQLEVEALQSGKEPSITSGITAQYWRGDKTWRDFFTDVRAATLTGLSTATNAVVTAANTVLEALGLLQKQITDHKADTANPHAVTKTQVGLANVDNVQQLPMSYLDTDDTLAANSDVKVASQKAAKTYILAQIAALVNSSPSALDTLKELADALGDDANFATTMTNSLAAKEAIVDFQKAVELSATASGTNTYTASISPAPASLSGLWVLITFTNANTGAATLNLNLLGAKSIIKADGSALTGGEISAGSVQMLNYNGTSWQILGGSSAALITSDVTKSADFTVTSADKGKMFQVTTSTSTITATIPSASSVPDGFYFFIRKADSGTGIVITSPGVSSSSATSGHVMLIWSDGSAWYIRHMHGSFNASGAYTLTSGNNQDLNLNGGGTTGQVVANRLKVSEYLEAINQASKPATPSSGFRLFSDSSGRLNWIGTNGYLRIFDGTANTADRTYTLPDYAGTVGVVNSSGSIPTFIDEDQIYIQGPTNKTYPLISKKIYAGTINGLYGLKTASGTCTVAIQINGTNVTGLSSISVTSSTQDVTASALNALVAGDRVTIVVSSASAPVDLECVLKITR